MPPARSFSIAALFALSLSFKLPPSPPGVIVFFNDTEGYHTFRIPNLVSLRGGASLLAFAEGRARNGFMPAGGDTIDC